MRLLHDWITTKDDFILNTTHIISIYIEKVQESPMCNVYNVIAHMSNNSKFVLQTESNKELAESRVWDWMSLLNNGDGT